MNCKRDVARHGYSTAFPIPSSRIAKVPSFSGRDGESYTLHIRFSPLPFLKYNLKQLKVRNPKAYRLQKLHPLAHLVHDACAMIFPPAGFLGSGLNMDAAPSTWATTWLVMTTAIPNSSASRCRFRINRAKCIWRAASSPLPEKSVRYSAIALSTIRSENRDSAIMADAWTSSAVWWSVLYARA